MAFGGRNISILFFADDIAVLAETKEDLETMLSLIYEYSMKWRCKWNYDKCGVIVFDNRDAHREEIKYGNCKSKCSCGRHFSFGPNLINEVLMYKYLGAELDYKLSFYDFKKRLITRARSNMGRVSAMGIRDGFLSVKASINLYQALVRSILEYSCEIWGFDKFVDAEKVQWDMGKRILHCPTKTTNATVNLELGLWSLKARRDRKHLIYWRDILLRPKTDLVHHVYAFSRDSPKRSNFAHQILKILIHYSLPDNDLSRFWYNPDLLFNLDGKSNNESKNNKDHRNFWKSWITKIIAVHEEKNWMTEVFKKPKLRTYRTLKKKLCFEKYLATDAKPLGRYIHTSLRNGANFLEIERGRWGHDPLPEELRICQHCDLKVPETEKHFVTACPRYHLLRMKLFKLIAEISNDKWHLEHKSSEEQFLLLIAGTGDEYETKIFCVFQNYLVKFMRLRNTKK